MARDDSRERLRKVGSVMWRMALGIVDGSQKMEAEVFRKGIGGNRQRLSREVKVLH